MSEQALWRRWQRSRDSAAFEALVAPQLGVVFAFAVRSGLDPSAAEDAVQDTLIQLAQERTGSPPELGIRTWLFRRVRDRVRSTRRSNRRRRAREERAAAPESASRPSETLDLQDAVERVLDRLEPFEREAVLLRYLFELSYEEAAQVMDCSENAARLRVHRALSRLRDQFGDRAPMLLAALPLPTLPTGIATGVPAATAQASALASTAGAFGGSAAAAQAATTAGGALFAMSISKITILAVTLIVGSLFWLWPPGESRDDGIEEERSLASVHPGSSASDRSRPSIDEDAPRRGRDITSPLGDLQPTGEEWAFLRSALERERQRVANATFQPDDTGFEILERVLEHGASTESLWSFEAFDRRVPRAKGVVTTVGPVPNPTQPLGERELFEEEDVEGVIEFGPGRYTLSDTALQRATGNALHIRGAGMDETVINADNPLMVLDGRRAVIRISDVTIVGSNAFIDARGEGQVILERVRFRGWYTTAGHSAPIGLSGRVFLAASQCEFVCGAGANSGPALSVRGKVVALFEDCFFSDMDRRVVAGWAGAAAGSTVHFSRCTFENARLVGQDFVRTDGPEFPVRVRDSQVSFGHPDWSVDEIASHWGSGAAEVERTEFAPGAPRATVATFLSIAQLDPDICAISVSNSGDVITPVYCIFTSPRECRLVREASPGRFVEYDPWYPIGRVRDTIDCREREASDRGLYDLLARLPGDTPVTSAKYDRRYGGEVAIPTLVIDSGFARRVTLDSRTGDPLE